MDDSIWSLSTRWPSLPSRSPHEGFSHQLAWQTRQRYDQLRGLTQSGNAEVASGTTSGGFATRVVPAPNPSRPALEAEPVLIPERMTRGLDTSPTVREIAEPMKVETPQTGEGLTRGSEAIQPHAGLARGSEATRSPGDPSMSSEVTPASTGLSSGFEARQTHGPFASGSEAQQPPGEVTSSSEADPAAGGLSAGSEELSVGSETSLSSSASAASHTSTMTTTASTVEPPQINYPQSASEEGSTVTSNPLQESSNVIHDPSTQWKETKMGHRLKIFTYDQMSKVANQFKDEICCEGGFGNVYKGKLTLECGVTCAIAIKRMKIESRTDQGEREFQREQSVASVRHPFIVPVLGVCEEPGKPLCIVYPYMEGGDLKGAIDTMDSRLTWQKCLAIITQVSSALIYMHSHNPRILHLDVKPANILLDAFFNARLGDVGLSREIDPYKSRASLTSSHPGTPGYQDPIMMQDWSTSPTNDIYSLGVVMFRALTRKPAFHECEKKPYCVFLKREGYLKDVEKVLELASKDIWPVDSTSENLSFTRKFAELMCMCLMTDPSERIELEDLHERIKTLARDASRQIYTEPAEALSRNLCVICYSNPRVPSLPLLSKDCRSSCDKVCLQCHLDSHKNPLVCPEHGDAKPPIGHCNSYAIFIGAEEFHRDATRLHGKFTNPNIGAIRKENAVLMTENKEGDLKPSPENILRQLSLMKEKMAGDEEASLIFYFSGHGSKRGSKLICNSSKEGLEASQLRQKIHGINFTQLLVILDCCYAAELGPLPSGFFLDRACSIDSDTCLKEDDDLAADSIPKFQDHGIPILYKLVETDVVEKGTPSKSPNYSVMQWSASKSQEMSVGYLDGTSLFTRHIIAGLQAAKRCPIKVSNSHPDCSECPRFRDKVTKQLYITLNELIDYVHSHVTQQVALYNRPSQTPQTVSEENTRNRKIAYCKPA
ncbi:uncharacterized protein [Ptychodera flava]|uniref:uncharacterized protein n=1 Tax=Ptychodera flava TaxID=63121 RepID=UPI00396A1667